MHLGQPFSTFDYGGYEACASSNHGAWWYRNCQYSNLNGLWGSSVTFPEGINWYPWEYDVKTTEMKMRPAV